MSKLVKNLIGDELKQRYSDVESAVWIEIVGMDGITNNLFRRALHGKQMKLEVVKTSLLRRVLADAPLKKLADKLEGPAALITGGESAVTIAKLVEEWLPKSKNLKLRGALLEGELIEEKRVGELSRMPTKRDMQARVAGMIRSPGAKLSAAILSPGGNIAGALKAMIEKLEKGEAITATA